MLSSRPGPLPILGLLVALWVIVGCSPGAEPELVGPVPTSTPSPTATPEPIAAPDPTATPVPTPTAEPTPTPVPERRRGIDDDTVRIGIVTTGQVFGDVDVGVRARFARANGDGGAAGRNLEIAAVIDDQGDPAQTLAAVRRLVEEERVFAVILASAVPTPEVTDYLARRAVPFFGWGFAAGFCEPNEWGFGFTGCVGAAIRGIDGAQLDTSRREVLDAYLQRPATVTLVTTNAVAGDAAVAEAEAIWGDQLVDVVRVGRGGDIAAADIDTLVERIDASGADAVVLAVALDRAIALKGDLVDRVEAIVVDDVTYLPGLLNDVSTAAQLEGGFAFTQLPPQEEYREVTGVVATDVDNVGGPLIYSRAITVGYWSGDLAVALLDAVGPDLDAAAFHRVVVQEGVRYDPDLVGGLCPANSRRLQRQSTGGLALVQVSGGIYRPAVSFDCHGRDR